MKLEGPKPLQVFIEYKKNRGTRLLKKNKNRRKAKKLKKRIER
jgi:hypothetical protein